MDHVERAAAERRRKELLRIEIEPALDQRWDDALRELQSHSLDVAAARALVRAGDLRIARELIANDEELRRRFMALSGEDPTAGDVPLRTVEWQEDSPPADFVEDFVDAVLGAAPDAARGRLLLRPCLKPEWTRGSFHNIRVGDGLVRLSYERIGENLRFTIVQTAGAYPLRLIFEPVLTAAPRYAFVDGKPAVLDVRAHTSGTIVPVQIMLDEEREVAFDMG